MDDSTLNLTKIRSFFDDQFEMIGKVSTCSLHCSARNRLLFSSNRAVTRARQGFSAYSISAFCSNCAWKQGK